MREKARLGAQFLGQALVAIAGLRDADVSVVEVAEDEDGDGWRTVTRVAVQGMDAYIHAHWRWHEGVGDLIADRVEVSGEVGP